jgi:hypothetical protein
VESDTREHELFGNLVFDIGPANADASHSFEKLFRRDGLADIARCPRLQRARHMDMVVMQAEDEDPRSRINDLQARDNLETANIGQVQIEDDEVGAPDTEGAQRLFSARRLHNLRRRLGGEQSPQSGPDNRVIVDDQKRSWPYDGPIDILATLNCHDVRVHLALGGADRRRWVTDRGGATAVISL